MAPRKRAAAKGTSNEQHVDVQTDVEPENQPAASANPKPAPKAKTPRKPRLTKPPAKAQRSPSPSPSPAPSSPITLKPRFPLALPALLLSLGAAYLLRWQGLDTASLSSWLPHRVKEAADAGAPGFFPAGCRWRDVRPTEDLGRWGVRSYEYWDEEHEVWTQEQPARCVLQPNPFPKGYPRDDGRTYDQCGASHCTYHNLWYNHGSWYRLADIQDRKRWKQVARDIILQEVRVADPIAFVANINASFVPGDTLLIDYVYFLHPTAIGHWLEHLTPTFSVLELDRAPRPDRVLLLHLKRFHIFEWVRAVLAVALGVQRGTDLPPVHFQSEVGSVWSQLGAPLEGVPADQWVCFERVTVMRDVQHDGNRTALSSALGRLFRRRAYELHGLAHPLEAEAGAPPPAPPRTITFHRKSANRRVVNEAELLEMLAEFGEVHAVEFDASTPFVRQLATMASTGLLLSVHTSALANAAFLPAGSAVLELIQRNWVWPTMDQSFRLHTRALGDVHHYAWRAQRAQHAVYPNPRDQARFGGPEWAGTKCDTEECVEAHTGVDVVVDVAAVRAVLVDRLPYVWAGTAPAEARLPWPAKDLEEEDDEVVE